MSGAERRRHPRKLVDIPAEVQVRGGGRFHAQLGQLSIGGSFIETHEIQSFGTELTLLFRLPGHDEQFVVTAVVRWSSPAGMGVQFGAMRAREIYLLSGFLVDKPSVPPASPTAPAPPPAAKPLPPPPPALPEGAAPAPPPKPGAVCPPPLPRPAAKEPLPLPPPADRSGRPLPAPASAELARLRDELRLADAVVVQREQELARLERMLAERDERLQRMAAEHETRVREYVAQLAARDAKLAQLEAARAELTAQGRHAADDLTRIRGIGPAFAKALAALGVRRHAQIAAWTEADVARVAAALRISTTRIVKGGWIASAAELVVATRGS